MLTLSCICLFSSAYRSMIAYYNKKYAESATKTEWIALQSNGSFVSEFQLMEAVTHRFPPDSLILFCSVGMELATDFFNRVRMNTIAEWQVKDYKWFMLCWLQLQGITQSVCDA